MVGLAGVLLPGLCQIAASVASVDHRAAKHVEADLLELVRDAIRQGPTRAEQLALGVLQLSHLSHPSSPSPLGRKDPLGA